jgi:hypothetical protein
MKTAASVAALTKELPKGRTEGVTVLEGTQGVEQIARDQKLAKASRGVIKASARRAAEALVALSHTQIVLTHLQPRWLRAEVERRLDAGEDVDTDKIAELRALGPALAVLV